MSSRPSLQWFDPTAGEALDGPDWREFASCAEADPEAFFVEKGGSTRPAKRVCAGCDVRAQCLEFALATDQRFGVWGGLSERERRRMKRETVLASQPTAPGPEKVCGDCKQAKPLTEFNKAAEGRDGHRNECRDCSHLRYAAWRKSQKNAA
jgi:WhiB family redox-sensing transcriptional regulator